MALLMCGYAYFRGEIFLTKTSMDILVTKEEQYFDESYEFSSTQGFNVAAMFTGYAADEDSIIDPTYGELVFKYAKWGTDANGDFYDIYEVLDTHICTKEELGLVEGQEEGRFMPIRERMKDMLEFYA